MALIVEDGTGKPDAESYADAATFAEYAGLFGRTIPVTEAEQEALLRRAALQMNTLGWKGSRAVAGQALAWPRAGVVRDGEFLPATYIPREIEQGQMALAFELAAFEAQQAAAESASGPVIRERVDTLEVQYAAPAKVTNTGKLLPVAADAASSALFADFLKSRGLFVVAHRA